jgi:hypothetical protein
MLEVLWIWGLGIPVSLIFAHWVHALELLPLSKTSGVVIKKVVSQECFMPFLLVRNIPVARKIWSFLQVSDFKLRME